MDTKVCSGCDEEKSVDEFWKNRTQKDGLNTWCKICQREYRRNWGKENPEKMRAYQKKWLEKNKEKRREYEKQYRVENQEREKQRVYKWREDNLERYNKYAREYYKEKRKNDIVYRIWGNVESAIFRKLDGNPRAGTYQELLGCSPEELVEHLESQLKDGMTMENYGEYWEMDHIKPFASFDLSDPEQQKECCHHSNIQPLTVTQNRRKYDKILDEKNL